MDISLKKNKCVVTLQTLISCVHFLSCSYSSKSQLDIRDHALYISIYLHLYLLPLTFLLFFTGGHHDMSPSPKVDKRVTPQTQSCEYYLYHEGEWDMAYIPWEKLIFPEAEGIYAIYRQWHSKWLPYTPSGEPRKWYSPSQVWLQIMCLTHSWPQQQYYCCFHYVIDVSHLNSLYMGGMYVKQNGTILHWLIWGSWVQAVPSCPFLQHDYEINTHLERPGTRLPWVPLPDHRWKMIFVHPSPTP